MLAMGPTFLIAQTPGEMAPETTAPVIQASAKQSLQRVDQTFTVIQKIYEAGSDQPAAHHRLLFDTGVVYDLPQKDTRVVTVYDPAQKQVTLLDRHVQQQTRISTDDLVQFSAQVKATATTPAQRRDLGLSAEVESSDTADGYTISFSGVHYDISSQSPAHPWMAQDFGRFSDLASRLNLLWHRGVPPFARMAIGFKLASQGELPHETTLTIERGNQSQTFRSTAMIGGLLKEDQATIEEVRGMMALYVSVPWKEFAK